MKILVHLKRICAIFFFAREQVRARALFPLEHKITSLSDADFNIGGWLYS